MTRIAPDKRSKSSGQPRCSAYHFPTGRPNGPRRLSKGASDPQPHDVQRANPLHTNTSNERNHVPLVWCARFSRDPSDRSRRVNATQPALGRLTDPRPTNSPPYGRATQASLGNSNPLSGTNALRASVSRQDGLKAQGTTDQPDHPDWVVLLSHHTPTHLPLIGGNNQTQSFGCIRHLYHA